MTGRNSLAPICGLGLLSAVALVVRGSRIVGSALLTASVVGLLGSGSRTAWLAVFIALGFASLVVLTRKAFYHWGDRRILGVGLLALTAGALGVVAGVAALWDESTFAQRRRIWRLLGGYIEDDPYLGVGWEAFWYTPRLFTDPLLQRGSAHGSVPELLLGVGVVGLILWAVVIVCAGGGTVNEAWRRPGIESWLWLSVVTFLLIENLTESFVLWFSYNWVLLIAAALRYGPSRLRARGPQTRESIESATM